MTLASELATIASDVLTEFGESISFARAVEGAYNTATGVTATSTDTTFSGYGAPTGYSKYEIANQEVTQSDVKLYLEKTSSVPLVGDYCTVRSVVYRVLDVRRVGCNGADVIYVLQLRV